MCPPPPRAPRDPPGSFSPGPLVSADSLSLSCLPPILGSPGVSGSDRKFPAFPWNIKHTHVLTVLLVDLRCSLLGFLRSPKQKKTKNDVNCKKINPRIEGDCVSDRAPFTWLSAACVALQSCPEFPEPCGAPPPSCCPDAFPPLSTPSGSASSPGSGSHGLLGTEHLKSAETTTQTQVYYCVLVCLYFLKVGHPHICTFFLPGWAVWSHLPVPSLKHYSAPPGAVHVPGLQSPAQSVAGSAYGTGLPHGSYASFPLQLSE